MCFCKCIDVEFLDPKSRGLAQAKIQLAELKILPYAVCKIGLGEHVCKISEHAKGQGKCFQEFLVVSLSPLHSQDAGKIPMTFKEAAEFQNFRISKRLQNFKEAAEAAGYQSSSQEWSAAKLLQHQTNGYA